jgi:hypothetical protein
MRTHTHRPERGSVLIVSLILAAIVAISLTSYLNISVSSVRLANRAFYLNAAQNLADTGLERALWALNNEYQYPSGANWTQGGFESPSSNIYRGTFPSAGELPSGTRFYDLSGGAKGQVKVWVGGYNPPTTMTWHAVAEATITLGDGTTLKKMSEAYLLQRSYSDRGMIARNGIEFNGNVMIDAWRSRGDPYNIVNDYPYSTTNRVAEAQIASPKLVTLQNADVFGFAAIGSNTVTYDALNEVGIDCGPSGRLRGVFPPGSGSGPGIDNTRVTCDFTCSFPDVNPPTGVITPLAADITSGTHTLSAGQWSVTNISLNAASDGIVVGPTATNVTLVVYGNISLEGGAKIKIYPGSSLTIYSNGNVTITGAAGIENGTATVPSNPDAFTLLGLRTEAQVVASPTSIQVWKVQGTSHLSCVIFGPNANIEVNGTGDTYGSIVGNFVDMVGSGNFHQDLSLASKRISGLWKVMKWRELSSAADRAVYASHLSF